MRSMYRILMYKKIKKTKNIKEQKKIFLFVLMLIITLFNFNFGFSATIYNTNKIPLELYFLKNPKTNEEYYINKEKKIIVKANGKNEFLNEEKDYYDDETKYIKKEIKEEEKNEDEIETSESKYEYYDLTGQKQNFNEKEILAIVNSNIIYRDGSCYNDTLKAEMKLDDFSNEVQKSKNENKKISLRALKFSNCLIISFRSVDKEQRHGQDTIYVYDFNLSLKKKFEQYIVERLIKIDDSEEVLVVYQDQSNRYNILDEKFNLLFDKNVYEFNNPKNNIITIQGDEDYYELYNLKTKKFEENKAEEKSDQEQVENIEENKKVIIKYEYNFESLSTIVKINDKTITLKDMKPQSINPIVIDTKVYLCIRERSHNYIYDINGKLIKILPDTESNVNIKVIGNVCFVNYSESKTRKGLKVFDKDFEFKEEIENQGKEDAKISLIFDKYIYIETRKKTSLYDKEFKRILGDFSINILDNKYIYYYDKNKNALVFYDKDLKLVKEIKNRYSIEKSEDFYLIKDEKKDLYDKEWRLLIKNVDNLAYIYNENGDGIKMIVASRGSKQEIYNMNFIKLYEVTDEDTYLNNNTFYLVDDNHFRIIKDSGKVSFYELGKGKVLDDYDYIGDFNKAYFTYAKDKKLGLMDYSYNTIYSMILEKSFSEDSDNVDDFEFDEDK